MTNLLSNLNKEQEMAVLHTDGPLLILAGAGSGKTTVLTRKIAYLIKEKDVTENNILAFTFTNKAANEMKDRIGQLLKKDISHMWVGTFHSICSKILRRDIDKIGFKPNFSIYDQTDSKSLVKQIMKDFNIDEKHLSSSEVISSISDYKNKFNSPDEMIDSAIYERQKQIAEIFKEYEKRKKNNNSLDFDDLILKTIELLKKDKQVREKYAFQFKYVFVDEYQDTNSSQYQLIKLFTYIHENVCVVGDGDQSIYSWRGADISNILNFEKDFANARVILLEQNYRSNSNILDLANDLIKNNSDRKEKNLWSDKKGGFEIVYRNSGNEYDEANDVVLKIQQMYHAGYDFKDMAILYRINSQSRVLEEKLMASDIAHKVVGGLKFYDRREVKDIIAYLGFISNPDDNLSFKRIVNIPKRGIGDTSINKLENFAISTNQSIYDAVYDENLTKILTKSAITKIRDFTDQMTQFINLLDDYLLTDIVEEIYKKSGYEKMLKSSDKVEDISRIENISALISAVAEFEKSNPEAKLHDYLQNVNLLSDVDKTKSDNNAVSLMTIHAAKGLEFDVVFLTGMEEGLFPSLRTMQEGGLEEERRLCYVAVTRAKERLFISSASSRQVFGNTSFSKKSQFVEEIKHHLHEEKPKDEFDFISKSSSKDFSFDDQKSPFDYFAEKRKKLKEEILQKNKLIKEKSEESFGISDRVAHQKFGEGMVISVSKNPNGDELLVNFEKSGLKRLNSKLAKLKKL